MMALTRNPFRVSVEDFSDEQNEDEGIQEEFLDLIHDSTVEASFEDEGLEKFWGTMEKAFPKVTEKPRILLTVFPSTYLCASAFPTGVAVMTKTRNTLLDLDSDLRCVISKIAPRISSIADKKQEQKSH